MCATKYLLTENGLKKTHPHMYKCIYPFLEMYMQVHIACFDTWLLSEVWELCKYIRNIKIFFYSIAFDNNQSPKHSYACLGISSEFVISNSYCSVLNFSVRDDPTAEIYALLDNMTFDNGCRQWNSKHTQYLWCVHNCITSSSRQTLHIFIPIFK